MKLRTSLFQRGCKVHLNRQCPFILVGTTILFPKFLFLGICSKKKNKTPPSSLRPWDHLGGRRRRSGIRALWGAGPQQVPSLASGAGARWLSGTWSNVLQWSPRMRDCRGALCQSKQKKADEMPPMPLPPHLLRAAAVGYWIIKLGTREGKLKLVEHGILWSSFSGKIGSRQMFPFCFPKYVSGPSWTDTAF